MTGTSPFAQQHGQHACLVVGSLAFSMAVAHDDRVPAVVAGPATNRSKVMSERFVDPRDRRRGGVESPVAGEAPALTTPASVGLGGGTSHAEGS